MAEKLSKAERTRQFIIQTTAGIFNTKGYAGTSLTDLTEATGLTKGSIYGNFENKDEVALAAFDFNLDQVKKLVDQNMAKASSCYEKIMAFVNVYDEINRSGSPRGGCPVLNTAVEADDTHALLKNRAATAINQWKSRVAELIRTGIHNGEFRPDTNAKQLSLSIVALIEGGILITRVTDDKSNFDHITRTVQLLLSQIQMNKS